MEKYEDHIGLIHTISRKCLGWVRSLDLCLDYEDVFQEVSVAFVSASRGFNPDAGVKFSAYLTRAAYNQLSRTVGGLTGVKKLSDEDREWLKQVNEENEQLKKEGKELKSTFIGLKVVKAEDSVDESGNTPIDKLEYSGTSPEEAALLQIQLDEQLSHITPLARIAVEVMRNPPEELFAEMQSQHAHDLIAVKLKFQNRAIKPTFTVRTVLRFLSKVYGYSKYEIAQAERELNNLSAGIEL